MSYYICNKIQYVNKAGALNNGLSNAGFYKSNEAAKIQQKKPGYVVVKTRNSSNGKDYSVITEPTFVGRDDNYTKTISAALPFETLDEARNYIIKNKTKIDGLDDYMIIDKKYKEQKFPPITQVEKLEVAGAEPGKRCKFTPATRKIIYTRSNGICQLCGKPMEYNDFNIDHIVPLSDGGSNSLDNLRAVHVSCNNFKANRYDNEMYYAGADIMGNMMFNNPGSELGKRIIRDMVRGMLRQYKMEVE